MVRLALLALSLLLMASVLPARAQSAGDVMQGIGRAMSGQPPYRSDRDWRDREGERAYWHERHRLDAEQRDLDARRRALHDQRRFDEENGFYGR